VEKFTQKKETTTHVQNATNKLALLAQIIENFQNIMFVLAVMIDFPDHYMSLHVLDVVIYSLKN